MNLASRAIFLWLLIYVLISNITTLQTSQKLLISSTVIFIFTFIEFLVVRFNAPSMCTMLCGYDLDTNSNSDQYLKEAVNQLKLTEQTSIPVEPPGTNTATITINPT